MGREIRMVVPNWEHPMRKRWDFLKRMEVQEYQPMRDEPFATAMDEWYSNWKAWQSGTHEDFAKYGADYPNYWDWSSGPPDPVFYRPAWKPEDMTWVQMYETVSEGTPVTPPFATKEELVTYLVEHGTLWDETGWQRENAESFVSSGWAPSLIVAGGKLYAPRDGSPP